MPVGISIGDLYFLLRHINMSMLDKAESEEESQVLHRPIGPL